MSKKNNNNRAKYSGSRTNDPSTMDKDSSKGYENNHKPKHNNANNHSRNGRSSKRGNYASKTNDVSWYNKNPELTRDVANLFFSEPVGTRWDVPEGVQMSVPGVMSFKVALTAGSSPDGGSPINASAADHYSWMRSQNTGSNIYDAPDQMLYFLAMDSIYSMWMFGARAYGIARDFTYANRYYPQALLSSGGWDPEDVWNNMSEFRALLETYACKLATMKVPADFDIYKRHAWLFSGIYLDAPSTKAQTYIFNPDGFYQYKLSTSTGAGMLKYIPVEDARWDGSVQGFFQTLDALIDPILNSQDMRTMSGDIIKLYGDNTYTLPKLDVDFKILPSYDVNVLLQIHNATICGKVMSNDVIQDVQNLSAGYSSLRCQPQVARFYAGEATVATVAPVIEKVKQFIDIPVDTPTPEILMEATRFSVGMERAMTVDSETSELTPSNMIWNITEVGSDFITSYDIYRMDEIDGIYRLVKNSNSAGYNLLYAKANNNDWYDTASYGAAALISQFNWHPLFYITNDNADDFKLSYLMEMNNYAFVDKSILWRLHNAALLSLYNVPHGR